MKLKFNINLSKVLFDLIAINIALGIANLIIFYTFWVDGWSYPSLFIFINLSTLLVFFLSSQSHFNPSFTFKKIIRFSLKYLLAIILFVTIYWLIVLDKKYYFVHLGLFYSFTLILTIFFRFIWVKIFSILLRRIFTTKNLMIVSYDHQKIIQTVLHNDWLKYSIVHSLNEMKPSEMTLYTKQFDLDLLIIDLKEKNDLKEEYKQISDRLNLPLLFLNPDSKKAKLERIIGEYKLFT